MLYSKVASAIGQSGRRDSDPRSSPWQGDALPLSHSRVCAARSPGTQCAEAQDRTADTAIFSRVLYHLSYLGGSDVIVPYRQMSVKQIYQRRPKRFQKPSTSCCKVVSCTRGWLEPGGSHSLQNCWLVALSERRWVRLPSFPAIHVDVPRTFDRSLLIRSN
jgi:hypothetical protein